MNSDQLRDWYLSLTDLNRIVCLALVANQLTVHGRTFRLDLTESDQIKAFEGLNEIQHSISGQIAAIGLSDERYPEDVLWNILQDKATFHGLLPHLMESFDFAQSRNCWKKPN